MIEHLEIPRGHRLHPERPNFLTASDLGAAAGMSAWKTPLQLYLEKTGQRPPQPENAAMKRGRLMEPVVAEYFREAHPGAELIDPRVMLVDRELRLGATPDRIWYHDGELVNVQLKTISGPTFERWDGVVPTDYQIQVACEAMLLDAARSVLAALVITDFNAELHCFDQERHPGAEAQIVHLAKSFWYGVDRRIPPKADYHAEPELVRELNPPDPNKPVPLDLSTDNRIGELLEQYERYGKTESEAHALREAAKAEIIEKLAGATLATLPGWKIAHTTVNVKERVVKAYSYSKMLANRVKETA